jgi:predicted dehydrogenase
MTQHGAAVVGTGFIGPVHIEGLRRAGIPIIGILGSTPEKSRRIADRFGVPRGYTDYTELLRDPDVIAVHIATPNRLHFGQASAALQAGKHILCEKPLAMTSAETTELVRLARDFGRAAGVCYNIRFYPLCLEMAERAREGILGMVWHIAGSYSQDWLFHPTDFNWRVSSAEGGALRAIADIGTHWLDLAQAVTGLEVEAVCADLQTVFPERRRPAGGVETFSGKFGVAAATEPVAVDTEDAGAILLRFRGGARGVVWVSQMTAGRKNCLRLEIAGSKESWAWDSESPNSLWVGHRDRANELLVRDPALLSVSARRHTDYPGGHNEGFPDTFKQLFRAFYTYIDGGDFQTPAPFPTFADGHREVLLCEAVLRSARERRWADVEEGHT